MTSEATVDVLIVGAGPTGLTLACDLARRGVRSALVEQLHQLFPGSRGKGLQPRTQEVFDDLGIIGAIQAAGSTFPLMRTWGGNERRGEWHLIRQPPDALPSPYPHVWMIPQWRTQEILHSRLQEFGHSAELGTALVGLEQFPDHVVAELESPDGSTRTVTAQYLVGADGGRSTVRQTLGIPMAGTDVALRSTLVADVRIPGLDRSNWHAWPNAAGGSLLLCPLAGTEDFQMSAQFETDEPDSSPERVRAVIATRSHLPTSAVTHVGWASYYTPRVALADRFQEGRVFLAGDAAHVHPPGGGQGLNIGVQEAYNLGWKLGQVLRHGAAPRLLESYQAERRPVAGEVLDISTRLYRVGRTPEVGSAEQAEQRGRVISRLGATYAQGPLIRDTRDALAPGALRAGHRAPDTRWHAANGTPGRLFDLFRGPHFTLLGVGCPLPPVPGTVRAHRLRGPAAREAYGEGLFLVRPDGYIGLATHDHADVHAYLADVGLG